MCVCVSMCACVCLCSHVCVSVHGRASLHLSTHLGRELHGQFLEDLPAEPRDDHPHRLLGVDAPLLKVKELVLRNLAGARLVLHLAREREGEWEKENGRRRMGEGEWEKENGRQG